MDSHSKEVLVNTLSNYVFYLVKHPANLESANSLLLSLAGDRKVRLPQGLLVLQSSGPLATLLEAQLHNKHSIRSIKSERSRDKLEKLLFELLKIYNPDANDWFSPIFEVTATPSLF
ncbi:MAG: hypothetical protein ACRYGK_02770 [Janthinobacterium lividum]